MVEGSFPSEKLSEYINKEFDTNVLPSLSEYIKIPNQSPLFDPEWEVNGHEERACMHIVNWIKGLSVKGLKVKALKEPGMTHTIFVEIEGTIPNPKNVFIYAHFDKQPPLSDLWEEGLGPTIPVIKDGKLYGRGASDDGYGNYAAILAIKALQVCDIPHPRCVMLFEGAEESLSRDLKYYLGQLEELIGIPDLIVCLDSGCCDYQRLWVTTSIRGSNAFVLKAQILNEGVHSGDGGGIVPDTFRIITNLLSRIEDPKTGEIIDELQVDIPQHRIEEIKKAASIIGPNLPNSMPLVDGGQPMTDPTDVYQLLLNRTWRAHLAVTGADGLPPTQTAGNVLRPFTAVKCSLRLPPSQDPIYTRQIIKQKLLENTPYGCKVEFPLFGASNGFNAPKTNESMTRALEEASKAYFGNEPAFCGIGMGIPFMNLLAVKYPNAQWLVTGVLGPYSNAHSPNEMLQLDYTKRLIACVSQIVAQFYLQLH